MDPAREFIDATMARLDELLPEPTPYKVGDPQWSEHDKPPVIKWRYGAITHSAPQTAGSIFTETQQLLVKIWHSGGERDSGVAEENTRTLKNALLVAARDAAQSMFPASESPPMTPAEFEWVEEANRHLGRALVGTLTIDIPVPSAPDEFVIITRVRHIGHAEYTDVIGTEIETEQLWDITAPLPEPPEDPPEDP
jgi:hypothetical protein